LVLSMEDPSTIRSAVADIGGAPYGGDSRAGQTGQSLNQRLMEQCTLFVLGSQYVLFWDAVYAPFSIPCSVQWSFWIVFLWNARTLEPF
jgi:hypothetical protein